MQSKLMTFIYCSYLSKPIKKGLPILRNYFWICSLLCRKSSDKQTEYQNLSALNDYVLAPVSMTALRPI